MRRSEVRFRRQTGDIYSRQDLPVLSQSGCRVSRNRYSSIGALLRVYVLPALNLSVSQAARDLEITRQTLHRILAGAAALTPEMAVRLERLCGVASEFWLDRQHRHELKRVRRDQAAVLARIPSRALPKGIAEEIGASDGR
jgi:antitoxin HigA-1